jgi:hypothetical protein
VKRNCGMYINTLGRKTGKIVFGPTGNYNLY